MGDKGLLLALGALFIMFSIQKKMKICLFVFKMLLAVSTSNNDTTDASNYRLLQLGCAAAEGS